MELDRPAVAQNDVQDARLDARFDARTLAATLPTALTVDEAAHLLRVNRKTLYDAVREGRVPGVVRMGRTIRIGRDALLDWLKGNSSPALGDDR
jgi:excisionase family DNA binding protein